MCRRIAYQNFESQTSHSVCRARALSVQSLVDGLDDATVRDEDTVQELTLVLSADAGGLAELGAAERDAGLVDTLEDELVLNLSAGSDLAAGLHDDLLDVATTEEVLDLNEGAVLGNVSVDGEMRIDASHLVLDALK